MEDRLDAALWLQPTTKTPPILSAGAVRSRLGGENRRLEAFSVGTTWWENACPDRTDLPRKIDEFLFLGITELGDGFEPPADSSGWHFRRCPRPGQGVLTGGPTRGLLVVLVSPRQPEQAQAFRDWADFTHIRHIASSDDPAVSGGLMITPYENVTGGDPRYMHLY